MFGTVFIVHTLQKCLLAMCSIEHLVLRINIHSIVQLIRRSQLPEKIEDKCWNEYHTCCWSHFSVIFGQLLTTSLNSEEQVFLPLSLLLSKSLHHAIHLIEHFIVHCDNVRQCDCMPLWDPHGPISEWPQYFHDILHNGPFILCCEEWPVFTVFWIMQPLACEFRKSVGALEQLQFRVPTCLHIHKQWYGDAHFGFLIVN